MAQILIIDDDKIFSEMLNEVVTDMGHAVIQAYTLADGLREAAAGEFTVILLDVNLPDGNGVAQIPPLRERCSAEIIIVTAYGSQSGAELALDSGAWDYLSKTASLSEIKLSLSRAIRYAETQSASATMPPNLDLTGMIGRSARLSLCFSRLAQAARSDANLLLTGETGTGKELFARALHRNSGRAQGPFITVDCASLTATLVESQLFGHVKGAYTGADRREEGMILQAHGGILFLDEVGELPLAIQKAFLRVLQEKHFRAVGGREELKSDFRTVAATNRNLDEMVRAGSFRSDLLYRLRSLSIELPPLREHREDIADLALFYTERLCSRYALAVKGLSPEFLEVLSAYEWPGNVRELVNNLESAVASAFDEQTLYPKHLPTKIRLQAATGSYAPRQEAFPQQTMSSLKEARDAAVREVEAHYLRKMVLLAKGDIQEGCRISGLSRPQLYALLKKHHLSLKDGPDKG